MNLPEKRYWRFFMVKILKVVKLVSSRFDNQTHFFDIIVL